MIIATKRPRGRYQVLRFVDDGAPLVLTARATYRVRRPDPVKGVIHERLDKLSPDEEREALARAARFYTPNVTAHMPRFVADRIACAALLSQEPGQ